ncbi:MAG TPA: bifunctional oligoribonuclease/PAP phosphatase NrnA, partial [Acidobacteriota bacterium]|nr:bifunctional oligoribonuclease/PAP phosphatase NrnA [Acidobacteriota bacterium]
NHEIQVYTHPADFEGESLDAVFILDISRWERLGALAEIIRDFSKPKICIDHHPYTGGFADYHLVNTKACASAEIVYDLIYYLGIPLNKKIAECIYASVLSDTGSFTFSNTNARSHKIAADLMQQHINTREIFEGLYQNHTPERLRFMGKVIANLQFDCESKLAWSAVSRQMLDEHGLCPEDVEGFVDLPRNCGAVVLSILFLETAPEDIKISLRAKGKFNANKLAGIFGGGGHNHASGIRMFGPLETVKQTILEEARRAMKAYLEEDLTAKTRLTPH